MNYLKAYCNLIRKAEHRVPPEGYIEKHHIFPVSIYGNNNKIVVLTAREHYISHALLEKALIKRYGINDGRTKKMITAFWCMNNQKTKNEYLNSHLYESSRIRYIDSQKGKKISEEQKKKISEALKNRIFSEEHKRKLSEANKGKKQSEEHRKKNSEARKGKSLSEETKEKISEANKDKNNPMYGKFGKNHPAYGKTHSKESKEKQSKALKGRVFSKETIEKMKQSKKGKNMGENNSKSNWWKITFKNGNVIIICGLHTWAKENGYCRQTIGKICMGKIKTHKDIVTAEKLDHPPTEMLPTML